MIAEFLYRLDIGFIYAVSVIGFLLAHEIGFRLGRRVSSTVTDKSISPMSTIQGAMLGLLALLLGFTFAMAISRFDSRKQVVLEEANAIGTTFLRAQVMPEPHRKEISNLLRQYVEVRLEFYHSGIDTQKIEQVKDKTATLHDQLWSHAVALGERDPRAITTGLFLQTLNELIDLHSKRLNALENHVPEVVLWLLYFVALTTIGLIGFGCGLGGRRHFAVNLMASLIIASVILVIIDLDRPRRGLIRVSQQRMVELRASLGPVTP
jgi:hypothetical protein